MELASDRCGYTAGTRAAEGLRMPSQLRSVVGKQGCPVRGEGRQQQRVLHAHAPGSPQSHNLGASD